MFTYASSGMFLYKNKRKSQISKKEFIKTGHIKSRILNICRIHVVRNNMHAPLFHFYAQADTVHFLKESCG